MSVLSPSEFRYAAISSLGLIIFTTLLKWTGVGQTRFTPGKPDTAPAAETNSTTFLETLYDPGGVGAIDDTIVADFLDIVVLPLQIFVDILLTWASVWDSLGFISIFIIAPMTIMIVIIAGVIITLWEVVYPG